MAESSQSNRVLLECVAGRDEHARVLVDERPLRLAHADLRSTQTGFGPADMGSGHADTGLGSAGMGLGSAGTGFGPADMGSGHADTGLGSAGTGSGHAVTGSGSAGTSSGSAGMGSGPALAVAEMGPGDGYLLFRVDKGALLLDAGECRIPVYVNNREVAGTVSLLEQDVLRIGNSIWRARYGGRLTTDTIREGFTSLIGLEELRDFRLAEVFSEVFKKHTQEEMEEQLITGTARHTPALEELSVGWAKPWLFARLLGASALLAFVLYMGFNLFVNPKLIPGLIFVGSFAVPISTLIFFLEMNVPRNVSIFRITQLLFFGGIASIIVALIFFSRFEFFSSFLGASAAGIIEETAKLLIVALLMGRTSRYNWIFNGLLFGAAVGTGFAAFESAGYAFEVMLGANSVDAGVANILLRGIDAPFTHIVWTANSAAALWIVKGDRPFNWKMLQAPAFLRVFISSVLIHMLWDAPFGLVRLPLVIDLKFVILGVLGWVICLRLVQAGLQQINHARQARNLPVIAPEADSSPVLP